MARLDCLTSVWIIDDQRQLFFESQFFPCFILCFGQETLGVNILFIFVNIFRKVAGGLRPKVIMIWYNGIRFNQTNRFNVLKTYLSLTTVSATPKCKTERFKKKRHMGNTRPSRICVIQEYPYYTMSLSPYKESLSISWVQVYTISLGIHHESLSISCIQFFTMTPSLYTESFSIPCR